MIVAAWQKLDATTGRIEASRLTRRSELRGLSGVCGVTRIRPVASHEVVYVEVNGIPALVSPAVRWLLQRYPYEWIETSRLEVGLRLVGASGCWAWVTAPVTSCGQRPAVSLRTNPNRVCLGGGIACS